MNTTRRFLLLTLLLLTSSINPGHAANGSDMDVINLFNRPAEDVIPFIKPLLPPDGAISGSGFKLIIRTTPESLAQIKKLIEEIDVALRKLTIYVSTDTEAVRSDQEASIFGQAHIGNNKVTVTDDNADQDSKKIIIDSGSQNRSTTRVYSTQVRRHAPAAQKVQVLEGQWATIRTGKSIPITQRIINPDGSVTQTTRYKKITTGFQVRAQLKADKVFLNIRPEQASLSEQGGGQINISGVDTTVTARLGEWIELGASRESTTSEGRGTVYSTQSRSEQDSEIFVKIDVAN